MLVVGPRPGMGVTAEDLRAHRNGRIARWWMPDDYIFLDAIPLGATRKVDKLALRELLRAPNPDPEQP